jgi:hypothetical protein
MLFLQLWPCNRALPRPNECWLQGHPSTKVRVGDLHHSQRWIEITLRQRRSRCPSGSFNTDKHTPEPRSITIVSTMPWTNPSTGAHLKTKTTCSRRAPAWGSSRLVCCQDRHRPPWRDMPPRLSGCCSLLFLEHLSTLLASPSFGSSGSPGMSWSSTPTTRTPWPSLDSYQLTCTSDSAKRRASSTSNHSTSGAGSLRASCLLEQYSHLM